MNIVAESLAKIDIIGKITFLCCPNCQNQHKGSTRPESTNLKLADIPEEGLEEEDVPMGDGVEERLFLWQTEQRPAVRGLA